MSKDHRKTRRAPPAFDLIDARECCGIVGGSQNPISRATLYRGIRAGIYPKPIHVAPNVARWLRTELIGALRKRWKRSAA